jgi:hypothetical protein
MKKLSMALVLGLVLVLSYGCSGGPGLDVDPAAVSLLIPDSLCVDVAVPEGVYVSGDSLCISGDVIGDIILEALGQ